MDNKMSFGLCLKFLLTTANIRMSQLAKAINVDSSLVNRWVNEKRIPSATYLENISTCLARFINNPLQEKMIEELAISLDETISTTPILEEKIYKILYHSLNFSLAQQDKVKDTPSPPSLSPSFSKAINLSEHDKILLGIENIFQALINLLDLAIEDKKVKNRKIYLTYHSNFDQTFFTKERLNILKQKLLDAMQNEWDITFLLRLDCNSEGSINFTRFILPLIKTGKIKLFYLKNSESFMTRKELYIVSSFGAISCFPTDSSAHIKSCFLLTTPSAIEMHSSYADLLVENNTSEIIEYYSKDKCELYFSTLTAATECRGSHYSYYNNFSRFLLPIDIYVKCLEKSDLTEKEKELSLQLYEKQHDSFIRNLHYHKIIDIYLFPTIDRLCTEKSIYLYTYGGVKLIPVDTEDVISYLEYVMQIIRVHPNYHIAIIHRNMLDIENNITLYIKERQMVFLDVHDAQRANHEVCLSIHDPITINAFVSYFNSIWNKISPLQKDKNENIAILKGYIDTLKRELS